MEEAAVHAADGLATEPILLLIAVFVIVIACVSIYVAKAWNEHKKIQMKADAEFRQKQLELDRERELRKAKEAEQRNERDRENAVIMRASIEAQERSTVAINESTAQMAVMAAKLDVSQQGSAVMKDKMDDMATEVHDIHTVIVK